MSWVAMNEEHEWYPFVRRNSWRNRLKPPKWGTRSLRHPFPCWWHRYEVFCAKGPLTTCATKAEASRFVLDWISDWDGYSD